MKLTITAAILPLLASAVPTPEQTTPEPQAPVNFGVMALRSASPIHFLPMNARGRHFYLGGKTTSYCPQIPELKCPPGTETVFASVEGKVPALDVMVPGGQQVYVEPNGALGFTQAHSASIPEGSLLGALTYKPGDQFGYFSFEGWGAAGLIACPNSEGNEWQVFANIQNPVVPNGKPETCLGFNGAALLYKGEGAPAWQYI